MAEGTVGMDFGPKWDGSWKALGAILGGFWFQVGVQGGAKLAPKSEKWESKNAFKKWDVTR